MTILVVCNGCKSSFQVSDQFAGKKGPCPKCKAIIQVPEKSEEIVIHAPEVAVGKETKARKSVTPLFRQETRISRTTIILSVVVSLFAFGFALYLRTYSGKVPQVFLIAGAVLLGPLAAWSGYGFLRNDELEPLRGGELWLRSLICGLVYATLWALYAYVAPYALDTKKLESYQLLIVVPVIVAIGGVASLASMELEYGPGLIHYGFYLAITVALAYLAGISVM